MVTFQLCVRKKRADGFYVVYIRVTHNRKVGYIKTDKLVRDEGMRKGEIIDPYVVQYGMGRIMKFGDRLNRVDVRGWSLKDVMDYLQHGEEDICFSDYARQHIRKLIMRDQERTSKNYEMALKHMERYFGTTKVMFSMLTRHNLDAWIDSMRHMHRCKQMYPICMRQVFKTACKEYNDYDTGIMRIKTNPWMNIDIPQSDESEKLAITPQECRVFFSAPIPENDYKFPRAELGHDVAMMILCLGGINTVDLYNLQKSDYYDGIIHYKRAKTKGRRRDEAYMEMRVPAIVQPIIAKYMADEDDSYLMAFHKRYNTSRSFNASVNTGIGIICDSIGLDKGKGYSAYTFRHTWGTIAQNDCEASISDVAFGMNHSTGNSVTRGYVKIDFSKAWELNEKVVELIFFTEKESHREAKQKSTTLERISTDNMVKGTAYFRGRMLGEIQDTGFSNVDEVIERLVPYVPDEVPERCIVQFKVENLDKKQYGVFERSKGKGF